MVHCTNPPGTLEELVNTLRPMDVMTHMYMNKGNTILTDGRVSKEIRKARDRGVLFEAADARAHFSFEVGKAAIDEDFYPDIIGTDLTVLSANLRPTAFSLTNQMAKYNQLGIPFEKVIALMTSEPARIMGMENEIGSLSVGGCADIAIFRKEECHIAFGDRTYNDPDRKEYPCEYRFRTMLTVAKGEMVYRDEMF